MTQGWQFALAMMGGLILVLAGLLIVSLNSDSAWTPLGWVFIATGLLFLAMNLVIRKRLL